MPSRSTAISPPPTGELQVLVLDRQRRRRVDRARLLRVLRGAARALRVEGEVSLVLTGDRPLRALNARYRGQDKPTDVLSFPAGHGGHVVPHVKGSSRRIHSGDCGCRESGLGDIVISVQTAERNARSLGRTLPQELEVLALHGFLHVLGYDHETDDGKMDRLEARLRRRLLR